MAAGATYEPIATTTLGSAATGITFSSIPSTYTDLRLIVSNIVATSSDSLTLYFNGDSMGSTYSYTYLSGNGTSAATGKSTNDGGIVFNSASSLDTTIPAFATADIMSYTSSVNKSALLTFSGDYNGFGTTERVIGLWRNTSTINSVTIKNGLYAGYTLKAGTTATLYGIKAA